MQGCLPKKSSACQPLVSFYFICGASTQIKKLQGCFLQENSMCAKHSTYQPLTVGPRHVGMLHVHWIWPDTVECDRICTSVQV
jgi:hypothetical protein